MEASLYLQLWDSVDLQSENQMGTIKVFGLCPLQRQLSKPTLYLVTVEPQPGDFGQWCGINCNGHSAMNHEFTQVLLALCYALVLS
jgi:hypothetical protein